MASAESRGIRFASTSGTGFPPWGEASSLTSSITLWGNPLARARAHSSRLPRETPPRGGHDDHDSLATRDSGEGNPSELCFVADGVSASPLARIRPTEPRGSEDP